MSPTPPPGGLAHSQTVQRNNTEFAQRFQQRQAERTNPVTVDEQEEKLVEQFRKKLAARKTAAQNQAE